jgi:hypothetical protein
MQEATSVRGARLTRFTEIRLESIVRALAIFTMAGRDGGFSATWMAPPPMIAPPAVQAHNFANAILTDISSTLFCRWLRTRDILVAGPPMSVDLSPKNPQSSSALTTKMG